MPVYNEEEALPLVLEEWIPTFRRLLGQRYTLCILNDGSTDNSLQIAQDYARHYPEIRVVDKLNSGHGQTCVFGYKIALANGADWVFQMDSDGQCIAEYFEPLLEMTTPDNVIYGYRKTRDDGMKRYWVSRIVSIFVWAATGIWVKDANVPYRLMPSKALEGIVPKVSSNFYLCNILVSVYQQKNFGIRWHNIHFRNRLGGFAHVKTFSFAKHGFRLFKDLRSNKRNGVFYR